MDRIGLRHLAQVQRLLLARLTSDPNAEQLIADEIGPCWHCWSQISHFALCLALQAMYEAADADMDKIIGSLERGIASTLDALADEEGDDAA